MEGQIRAISSHMEGQETSDSDPHQGKLQNHLAFCTHPDVRGFNGQTRVHRDVCKRPNSFGVFLDVDPSHLSLSLTYALR